MSLFRTAALLGACLGLQVVLGRLLPESQRYVDFMALPVIWHAIACSQRSAMLTGCAAGLLQDAWFQIGTLGMNGFIKTFLGWAVGALGTRFDLNGPAIRVIVGALFAIAQSALEVGIRRLLVQVPPPPRPIDWVIRAAITGLAIAVLFPILDRVGGGERSAGVARAVL